MGFEPTNPSALLACGTGFRTARILRPAPLTAWLPPPNTKRESPEKNLLKSVEPIDAVNW